MVSQASRSRLEELLARLDPRTLYRRLVAGGEGEDFEVVARPGERLAVPPQPGDLLLRVGLGEPGVAWAGVVADGGSGAAEEVATGGVPPEDTRRGTYAAVADLRPAGTGAGTCARRIADAAGYLPPGQMLVRLAVPPQRWAVAEPVFVTREMLAEDVTDLPPIVKSWTDAVAADPKANEELFLLLRFHPHKLVAVRQHLRETAGAKNQKAVFVLRELAGTPDQLPFASRMLLKLDTIASRHELDAGYRARLAAAKALKRGLDEALRAMRTWRRLRAFQIRAVLVDEGAAPATMARVGKELVDNLLPGSFDTLHERVTRADAGVQRALHEYLGWTLRTDGQQRMPADARFRQLLERARQGAGEEVSPLDAEALDAGPWRGFPPPPPFLFAAEDDPKISPFADNPYDPGTKLDAARTKDLTDAIASVRAGLGAADQKRLDRVAFAIARLDTAKSPLEFAGVKADEMFFSASLLKIAILFASFELRAQVNRVAGAVTATGAKDLFAKVKKEFDAAVAAAIPAIKAGEWRRARFDQALAATAGSGGALTVDLGRQHRKDLESIFINQRQNLGARRCIHRLGYSWINGALAAGGFFDVAAKRGIWLATDFGGGWSQFHVPVSTGGTSSVAMTCEAMLHLLAAMRIGTLVDPASSGEMVTLFSGGLPWLSAVGNPGTLSFTITAAKVGHAASGSARVGSVMSEAAFLDRGGVPFVAVWQNYPDGDVMNVYRVIDEVVKKWP